MRIQSIEWTDDTVTAMRVLPVLLSLMACGKSEHKEARPAGAFMFVEKLPPALRGRARLEINGVTGEINQPENGYGGAYLTVMLPSAPPAGTKAKVHYTAPCGDRELEFAVPAEVETNGNRVTFKFPQDLPLPVLTLVLLDPELKEPVQIGTTTLAPQPKPERGPNSDPATPVGPPRELYKLLDIACAKEIKIGATSVTPPARTTPAPTGKETNAGYNENVSFYADDTIFLTNRPEQCFVDRIVGYGEGAVSNETRLKDARVHRLQSSSYDVWFEPAPTSVKILRSTGNTTQHMLDVCPPT